MATAKTKIKSNKKETAIKPLSQSAKKVTAKKDQTDLSAQLHHQFGFDGFKGPQEEIIESLLSGNDTFVIMPTGGGKVYVINFRPSSAKAWPLLFLP